MITYALPLDLRLPCLRKTRTLTDNSYSSIIEIPNPLDPMRLNLLVLSPSFLYLKTLELLDNDITNFFIVFLPITLIKLFNETSQIFF